MLAQQNLAFSFPQFDCKEKNRLPLLDWTAINNDNDEPSTE